MNAFWRRSWKWLPRIFCFKSLVFGDTASDTTTMNGTVVSKKLSQRKNRVDLLFDLLLQFRTQVLGSPKCICVGWSDVQQKKIYGKVCCCNWLKLFCSIGQVILDTNYFSSDYSFLPPFCIGHAVIDPTQAVNWWHESGIIHLVSLLTVQMFTRR